MSRLTMQEVIEHCERTVNAYNRKTILNNIETKRYWEHKQTAEWLKELQHYKDLEEQGRLIEQKHGRWIHKDNFIGKYLMCSECSHVTGRKSTYCPNCGAKMVKGTEE